MQRLTFIDRTHDSFCMIMTWSCKAFYGSTCCGHPAENNNFHNNYVLPWLFQHSQHLESWHSCQDSSISESRLSRGGFNWVTIYGPLLNPHRAKNYYTIASAETKMRYSTGESGFLSCSTRVIGQLECQHRDVRMASRIEINYKTHPQNGIVTRYFPPKVTRCNGKNLNCDNSLSRECSWHHRRPTLAKKFREQF